MPYGITRLNVKKSQPNPSIVFIKPLAGPDEKIAQDFLERIAAQCVPIMREHTLSVMSLEEFPPNREFVGRNFNAGEVIQLVLKSPSTGRWLPFEYVQMVMMHELAHCKQMNHSKAFWAVRNGYATEMYGLWRKGYTGEGIWGRGAKLSSGQWEKNTVLADEILPEHLCGGTYRSRGRKRKAKQVLSYQERKERRILKKFGKNGMALGADEEAKVKLEKGKKVQGKPRVAGSARGRELRAAAALARFETVKPETDVKDEEETDSGSETDYDDGDSGFLDALDLDGSRLVDRKGHGMVKICEDEEGDDPGARDETQELRDVLRGKIKTEVVDLSDSPPPSISATISEKSSSSRPLSLWDIPEAPKNTNAKQTSSSASMSASKRQSTAQSTKSKDKAQSRATNPSRSPTTKPKATPEITIRRLGSTSSQSRSECAVCTYTNDASALRCEMCANVLKRAADPAAWPCTSDVCKEKGYVNAGDCGVCGLCGEKKAS